jgi:hypothetical protein
MNRLEGSKSDVKVSDLASNATHTHTIDTKGFSKASIDVSFEPVAAAGTNSTVAHVLTLQHGDTTGSFAAIAGFVAGTDYWQHERHHRRSAEPRPGGQEAVRSRQRHASGRQCRRHCGAA